MWNKNEAVEFTVPVKDTLSWYSISINLRNRTDYAFQNLYLFIKTKSPDGGFTVDTLNYMLARDDGSWTGSGGLFSMYKENVFLYRKYVKFPVKGDYTVNIIHGMREDNLQGIASVGLILQ
jgi:gliding motility-associated lipoprotein GldH